MGARPPLHTLSSAPPVRPSAGGWLALSGACHLPGSRQVLSPALRLLSASLEGNHIVQETASTRGPWCLPWGLCLKDTAPAL